MKRLVVLTLLLVMAVGFVAASFSITGYSFGGSFSPYENITGTLNISIDSEDFFSKITSSFSCYAGKTVKGQNITESWLHETQCCRYR